MEYYKESFVAELDLENLVFKELDVPYPEIYYDTHFGFRDIPTGTIGGDGKLNFTFSISSNLYQYSETEGQVRAFGATSDFTDNMANELPIADCTEASKAMKHNLLNVKYLQLLFDPYKNLYYRFHWGQVPERKNDGNKFI